MGLKAVVKMLDGTERHVNVLSVERDGCKFAPPLMLDLTDTTGNFGEAKYMGKGTGEPCVYVQQSL